MRFLLSVQCLIISILECSLAAFPELFDHVNTSEANFFTHNVHVVERIEKMTPEGGKFPDDFLFGATTSAFQCEGGWNVSDKSESNWEFMIHQWPQSIKDGSNADVASNSYYMYETDVQLLKQIGANSYRISLSWTRILPTGFSNYISVDGVNYYRNVIDELLANDIEPHVTIYHWDLPQKLQELGGWTNPLIVDWFVNYARVVFSMFGDKVKLWTTINEPSIHCAHEFGGKYIPVSRQSGIADYLCGHYSLLAHAKTYRMYNEEFRSVQNGRVGIVLQLSWGGEYGVPGQTEATELWFQWRNNWFLHPLFTDQGDYPEIMKEKIAKNSHIQGFSKSRLPEFTEEEIQIIKYSCDFLGVNFYSTELVEKWTDYDLNAAVSYYGDMEVKRAKNVETLPGDDPNNTPWAFVEILRRVNDQYNIPMIYITENGYPDSGERFDFGRARYHRAHLVELQKLIAQGMDVRGYFVWSLLDNFEWTSGYSVRYGLFSIDITDPYRTRIPKISTVVISDIYKSKSVSQNLDDLPMDYNRDNVGN